MRYCSSETTYHRRESLVVNIGDVPLGGHHPIRIQSMAIVDTMDTDGVVAQVKRMADAGCEYARLTAPSIKEAKNLEVIKKKLRQDGYTIPLVADIHFTPNAAETAARLVEKVRINPGNYNDKKKFEIIDYTDAQYREELEKIEQRFSPLVKICKEYGTAMRIGVNHGSLSDRIVSRYGDSPVGMVESALEFIRVAEDLQFYNLVLSMKSSNPVIMVEAYRLLVARLTEEKLKPYPLHLGVTEAGDGQEGRIKSAVGIGALLEDGIGDTIRVSLTEEPEEEVKEAKKIVARLTQKATPEKLSSSFSVNPFQFEKRHSTVVNLIGGAHPPVVVLDFSTRVLTSQANLFSAGYHYSHELDKWKIADLAAEFLYMGKNILPFPVPDYLGVLYDAKTYEECKKKANEFPLYSIEEYEASSMPSTLHFLKINQAELSHSLLNKIKQDNAVVLFLQLEHVWNLQTQRYVMGQLSAEHITSPVIIGVSNQADEELFLIESSINAGGLFVDGIGDGIWLSNPNLSIKESMSLSFGILQACRLRMSKTEYISCPSCGRTLFDLQTTTAVIRSRTSHLKGLKIGIMGCIVNGPGEMADADYGYVGSGVGKITLYRGKEIVERNIQSENALDKLIELIKSDGRWVEVVEN